MKKALVLAITAAALCLAGSLFAADGKKVIINELKATGVNVDTVATLGEILCTHFTNGAKDMNVVCAADVKVVLQSKNEEALLGSCNDDKCYGQLAKALEAQYVLTGSVGKVGEQYVVNLTVIDAEKGTSAARASVNVAKEGDLIDGVKKAADDAMKILKEALKKGEKKEEKKEEKKDEKKK